MPVGVLTEPVIIQYSGNINRTAARPKMRCRTRALNFILIAILPENDPPPFTYFDVDRINLNWIKAIRTMMINKMTLWADASPNCNETNAVW